MASKDLIVLIQGKPIAVDSDIHLITLLHPRGYPVVVLLKDDALFELQSFQPNDSKYGSWFINQRVSSQHTIKVASKVDPRLYFLPYLEKNGSRFTLIEQMTDPPPEGVRQFPLSVLDAWKLEDMCDMNDKLGDMVFYRYSEAKALDWLAAKVMRTSRAMAKIRSEQASLRIQTSSAIFDISAQTRPRDSAGGAVLAPTGAVDSDFPGPLS